ncbi:MAG: hypothetical protein C0501_15540 [Isosphaera sp.]|nr:hypothetical protein [Isosphaera sp.]
MRLSATAGPDGVLRPEVPTGSAGGEFEVQVVVTPKPAATPKTPEELGWPPGFFENVIGSIDDEAFVAPPRHPAKPIPPLDAE